MFVCLALSWFSVWLCIDVDLPYQPGDVTHCAPIRRSPGGHSMGESSPVTCFNSPSPNICLSSPNVSISRPPHVIQTGWRQAGLVQFVRGGSDHLRASFPFSHYGDCLAISSEEGASERESERPGALQSFSVLIFTSGRNVLFCGSTDASTRMWPIVHFSDVTLGRVSFVPRGWTVS